MKINFKITKKQKMFIDAAADEVLFGGAAGGGKSFGQLIDAFLFAMKYPKSKQLILRRTYPELEKSLIRVSLQLFPKQIYKYNSSQHTGKFTNGSIIDFGYCDSHNDVYKYQSAEYDIIRFDELTHFEEDMYVYLLSRIRGANNFPKQAKSSTNPGGVGHHWVKERFIDPAPPYEQWETENGTHRVFIPSLLTENKFLLSEDPNYIKRLKSLDENDIKALLYGEWDIYEGQYFTEFKTDIHVIKPFIIPKHWKRYFTMDYGLDMLAAYVIAVDTQGRSYVIKEFCQSNLIISEAAEKIRELCKGEDIVSYYAPPDMWNRRQDTGKSVAEIFLENGIMLVKSSNDRVHGWLTLKEYLKPFKNEMEEMTANMVFFENCREIIKSLPALTYDSRNPNDVANEPHELTHSPDAIRYFVSARPMAAIIENREDETLSYDTQIDNFVSF